MAKLCHSQGVDCHWQCLVRAPSFVFHRTLLNILQVRGPRPFRVSQSREFRPATVAQFRREDQGRPQVVYVWVWEEGLFRAVYGSCVSISFFEFDSFGIRFACPPGRTSLFCFYGCGVLVVPGACCLVSSCDVVPSPSHSVSPIFTLLWRSSCFLPISSSVARLLSLSYLYHDQIPSLRNVLPLFTNPSFLPPSSVFLNTALLQWAFTIRADPKHPIDELAFTESANAHPKPFKVVFEPRVGGGSVEGLRELMEEYGV